MAIPASGPISMSMFNTELGRTSNTADSRLASGSTPVSPSLFWLANQSSSLNQTAPHGMGEWYGYTAVVNFYNADLYDCLDCAGGSIGSVVVRATETLTTGKYYGIDAVDRVVLINSSATGPSFDHDVTQLNPGSDTCAEAECGA